MLHATEIIGAETYDSLGNYVGRVKEMFVEPADQTNRIAHLLLGSRPISPLGRPLRPDRFRRSRQNQPDHRRIRPRRSTIPMKPGSPSAKTCSTSKS